MTRLCLAFILIAMCAATFAQVVVIEPKRFADDTARFQGHAGFKFNLVENTQRSLDLGVNGRIQYITGRHRAFSVTDLTLTQVEDNAFQNTGFQHFRHNYLLRTRWYTEAFAQVQFNKPLRIDIRVLNGIGMRWVTLDRDQVRLAVGTAVMGEYERDRENDLTYTDLRSSSYLSATYKVEPTLQLTGVVYFQPVVGDASDQRVAIEGQLRVRATRRLLFDSRLAYLRDTVQAPGVPLRTYRWDNVFSFTF